MKKIIYIIFTLITLATIISCSNFEELNTNPNSSTKVTPGMLATQLLRDGNRFWNPNPTDWATAQLWCKHTVLAETNPNPYQYYYSFWPYGGLGYQSMINAKAMSTFAAGSPMESSYKGLELFLKAASGFGKTVSMGDVPYSEAGLAEQGNVTPKYDKQADVFAAVLNDLKAAEALFATGVQFDGDIMFGGNPVKWRKYCNAMQLEIIQLISKKATVEQKARFAAIVSAGNLMADNSDSYQLVYTTNTNASHPYYDGFVKADTHVPSDMVIDLLKKTNDRRLFYFADPAPAKITSGLTEKDYDAYVGASPVLPALTIKLNNDVGMYSHVNIRYTKNRDGEPNLKFSYALQCFIIAEAIEEGWVSGNSQVYYENGVKSMLMFYMDQTHASNWNHGMPITQSYIDGYFTGEAAYKSSKADRLKQILEQRWLIDYFQGNDRSYYTFLRSGHPAFPLDPSTSMNPDDPNVYPKRWKYPTGEITTNGENYKNAVQEQFGGYDGINEKPWWLK